MARLWSSGFELQSVVNDVEFSTVVSDATLSINTTIKRSGEASGDVTLLDTDGYVAVYQGIPDMGADDIYYARFYLRIIEAPDAITSIACFYYNNTDVLTTSIKLNSDRTLELWEEVTDDGIGQQIGNDSPALDLNTWYRVEFSADYNTDNHIAKLDGVEFASGIVAYTAYGDEFSVGINVYGGAGQLSLASSGHILFDDLAVNDNSGSKQTSFPGAGSIVHMQPNAAGDNVATSGLYSDIDEVIPNNATDYIELDTNGVIGDYNMETSLNAGISASDAITLVQIGIRHRPQTAAKMKYKLRVKSQVAGTVLEGTETSHNDTTWKTNGDALPRLYKLTSYVDPQAAGDWTPTLLDTMQIGVEATDATPDIWITTLWALVEYIAVPPARRIFITHQ